jgi:hypothetical protein
MSKTNKQILGQQFHRGILMVDSSNNENSLIYGEKAKDINSLQNYKEIKCLERRTNLAVRTSSIHTNGNIIDPESVASRVKINKDYQSKGGIAKGLSFDETHNRIFYRKMGKAPNTMRAQALRDQDIAGKNYNIITHTLISEWPGHEFHRDYDRRLDHPSQAALEQPRNTQGAIQRK